MGFLDHSTNNIIVDAVLTDYGRSKLANQGANATALVKNYAFADDEVDYSMITKYGVQVGKEKIEKNTPIFEASTNANFGVQFLLSSTENPAGTQPTFSFKPGKDILVDGPGTGSTTLTAEMTDPEQQGPSAISYNIVYDSKLILVTGDGEYKATGLGGDLNRLVGSEKSSTLSQSFGLQINPAGIEKLIQLGLGNETSTTLTITTSTDKTHFVTIQLKYRN